MRLRLPTSRMITSIDFSTSRPGLGDAPQALAVAREDVDAELALELEDRLGDAGLRGEQRLGGFGQVEVAADRFLDEPELVEVHGKGLAARGRMTR